MGYEYMKERSTLFTEEGQLMLLRVRDFVQKALQLSGAVTMGRAIGAAGTGDTWMMLACADRLVELGEIREIQQNDVAAQCRVFVSARG